MDAWIRGEIFDRSSSFGGRRLLAYDATAHDAAGRLRRVVGALMEKGRCRPDIQSVAGLMNTSVRTLQRRLRETGLTYAGIVQQARCAVSRRMLKDGADNIGEIARVLGYSDHAHFTRAFQRWTGVTPHAFRRGRRS
jgi:AraC-like DNA-binding protein